MKQYAYSDRSSDNDPYRHKDGQQTQIMKSVDLTQRRMALGVMANEPPFLRPDENATNQTTTSALASIMTSPIAAKLTSFIPFSWGVTAVHTAPAAIDTDPSSSVSGRRSSSFDRKFNGQPSQNARPQGKDRGFVKRHHQLKKLEQRMSLEGKKQMSYDVVLRCRKCSSHGAVL